MRKTINESRSGEVKNNNEKNPPYRQSVVAVRQPVV